MSAVVVSAGRKPTEFMLRMSGDEPWFYGLDYYKVRGLRRGGEG